MHRQRTRSRSSVQASGWHIEQHPWQIISHPSDRALFRRGSSFKRSDLAHIALLGGLEPGTRVVHATAKETTYYVVCSTSLGFLYFQQTDADGALIAGGKQLWPAGSEDNPRFIRERPGLL